MPPLHRVLIGIGSNLGDREKHCAWAVERLDAGTAGRVVRTSSLYETEPHTLRGKPAPWYINAAVLLETSLPPAALQWHLHRLEADCGRRRESSWEPRTLDLDLLLYSDLVLTTHGLTLPHPQIARRRFVLVPLAEIAPEVIHPVLKKSVARLLQESVDTALVRPL